MAAVGHAVEVVVEHGQRLQALDEAVGVVVKDDTLVQQTVGVEDGLELFHHLVGLLAPLIRNEGSHIAACAVLSLQRAVVVLDHQTCHVAHHLSIASHLVLVGKTLVEDEVVVALEGVAVDAGVVVTVVGYQFLQLDRGFGQRLDGEGDVLDEARRAHRTGAADAGEDAAADCPILAVDLRILGELGGYVEAELRQTLLNLGNLLQQLLMGHGLRLGEDGSQVVVVARLDTRNLAGVNILLILQEDGIVDRRERLVVDHLGRLHHQLLGAHRQVFAACLQFLHRHDGLAALLHGHEVDHGRGLKRVVLQRLHGHLRQEGQRALRADDRVGDDVEGVVVGHERAQIQSRNVLDAILL